MPEAVRTFVFVLLASTELERLFPGLELAFQRLQLRRYDIPSTRKVQRTSTLTDKVLNPPLNYKRPIETSKGCALQHYKTLLTERLTQILL